MWVLIDAVSKERLSERFSSQAKLAKFLHFSPKTLNKAINEGRNKFQFRGREVTIVDQKVTRFSVHESPSDPPLAKFETETEMAAWIGVTRQAVSCAFKRTGWCQSWKIRKNGKDYFMKRIADKEPVGSLPEAAGAERSEARKIPTISQKPHAIPVRVTSASSTKIYPNVSAATSELGIDARTIHDALKSGRNSFTRRRDGVKFQVEKASLQPQKKSLPRPADVVGQKALDDVQRNWGMKFQWMKNHYPGWELTLTPDMEKFQTKRVLFNPNTGSNFPMKVWQDFIDYFDKRYLDYPYETDFVNYFAEGVWKFSARISETEFEPWFCFVLQGQEKPTRMETPAANREKHALEDEEKMVAWAEENAKDIPSPEEKAEEEWEKNEKKRVKFIESERNPFHPDIWKRCENAPMDPEFAFLRNMRQILPPGFRVKTCTEKDNDKMQFLVASEHFDNCVVMGPTAASLEVGFPFPAPPREILETDLWMPIFPLDVRKFVGEWYWRVQIVPK